MSLVEFMLLVPISLFAIINPLSAVPAFLTITPDNTAAERIRMARFACALAAGIIILFAFLGQYLFQFLGITLPALQIAGGLVLLLIGFDMLRAPQVENRITSEEKEMARGKDDIAVSPLAVPLLCGPGAISTVVVLQTQSDTWAHDLILLTGILVVYVGCYYILYLAARGAARLNPIVLRVLRRIMGLLFATIAVQFMLNGIDGLPYWPKP